MGSIHTNLALSHVARCFSGVALGLLLLACEQPTTSRSPNAPTSFQPTQRDASWEELRARPIAVHTLEPGAACPVTMRNPDGTFGTGPVYAEAGSIKAGAPSKILWVASPKANPHLLIRGLQLDGPARLLFNWTADPVGLSTVTTFTDSLGGQHAYYAEMDLLETATTTVPGRWPPTGWRLWPSSTLAPTPGCYAWQVDGVTLSEVIVFQVM